MLQSKHAAELIRKDGNTKHLLTVYVMFEAL